MAIDVRLAVYVISEYILSVLPLQYYLNLSVLLYASCYYLAYFLAFQDSPSLINLPNSFQEVSF